MTTWTLSGFADEISDEPAIQLAVLQALGARHVEVRSAWGVNALSWDNDQVRAFSARLAERGLAVSALASPIGKVDVADDPTDELKRLHRAIQIAQRLGTHYIRVFSFYRSPGVPAEDVRDAVLLRLATFAREAAKEEIVLLHENEKGVYGDTPERVLDIVESVGSPALRLAWDSANFVQVGARPFTDGYRMLAPHIEYLQVKDALAHSGEVVPAGEGDGELVETLAALQHDGFAGFVSLEPHLPSDGPGFPGPAAFGKAARALRRITDRIGVTLS